MEDTHTQSLMEKDGAKNLVENWSFISFIFNDFTKQKKSNYMLCLIKSYIFGYFLLNFQSILIDF